MRDTGQPSAGMRKIARRLLASAAAGSENADDPVGTTLRVYANVRGRLSLFLGPTGFEGLMSRSLAISAARQPEFAGLRLNSDGIVQGLREYAEGRPIKEVLKGLEDLVSQLIHLVSTFIGEELTERLTAEVGTANTDISNYTISGETEE